MSEAAEEHLPFIARALVTGRVTPFLGAGANRCGRPEGESFRKGLYLPDGRELADSIAAEFGVTEEEKEYDLLQISQYVSLMSPDESELGTYLHKVFDAPYPPTHVHTFLAGLPGRLRENGLPSGPTTRSSPRTATTPSSAPSTRRGAIGPRLLLRGPGRALGARREPGRRTSRR